MGFQEFYRCNKTLLKKKYRKTTQRDSFYYYRKMSLTSWSARRGPDPCAQGYLRCLRDENAKPSRCHLPHTYPRPLPMRQYIDWPFEVSCVQPSMISLSTIERVKGLSPIMKVYIMSDGWAFTTSWISLMNHETKSASVSSSPCPSPKIVAAKGQGYMFSMK